MIEIILIWFYTRVTRNPRYNITTQYIILEMLKKMYQPPLFTLRLNSFKNLKSSFKFPKWRIRWKRSTHHKSYKLKYNSCYYRCQRFDMQTRRKGQTVIACVASVISPLQEKSARGRFFLGEEADLHRLIWHTFEHKRIFDCRRNCNNSYRTLITQPRVSVPRMHASPVFRWKHVTPGQTTIHPV